MARNRTLWPGRMGMRRRTEHTAPMTGDTSGDGNDKDDT